MALVDSLLASRRRSIAAIDARVQELEVLLSKAPAGTPRAAVEAQIRIAVQRKARLLEELAGFQALINANQVPLPLDGKKRG